MTGDEELAEVDMSEDEIDTMMATGEPVTIVTMPWLADASEPLYTVVTEAHVSSRGGAVVEKDVFAWPMRGAAVNAAPLST